MVSELRGCAGGPRVYPEAVGLSGSFCWKLFQVGLTEAGRETGKETTAAFSNFFFF